MTCDLPMASRSMVIGESVVSNSWGIDNFSVNAFKYQVCVQLASKMPVDVMVPSQHKLFTAKLHTKASAILIRIISRGGPFGPD